LAQGIQQRNTINRGTKIMLGKLLVVGVTGAVVGLASLGGVGWSYVRTVSKSAQQAVQREVPIEFELQRARDLVSQLVPDIRHCMHVIAEEEVGIEDLSRELLAGEKHLGKQKDELLTLKGKLEGGGTIYQVSGRSYTPEAVRKDLAHRFTRYKTAEETLSSKRQILNAREQGLAAAREKLEGLLTARRDLEVQIEHLDARVKTIQAAQTASQIVLDDSQLSQAKALIRDLHKQLDVTERMLDAEGRFTGLIPVETESESTVDLTAQIDAHFGANAATGVDVAVVEEPLED
jgi:hypothetical protein